MGPTKKKHFGASFENSFHTGHNGAIPSFIFYSHAKIRCVHDLTLDAWRLQISYVLC